MNSYLPYLSRAYHYIPHLTAETASICQNFNGFLTPRRKLHPAVMHIQYYHILFRAKIPKTHKIAAQSIITHCATYLIYDNI